MQILCAALACAVGARADVVDDLLLLRDRCLFYSAGRAPNDPGVVCRRHGLWAQSPFSPEGEIDLAATGFALANLPSAVEAGILSAADGASIAGAAADRLLEMVTKSAAASSPEEIARYGYAGVLFHYAVWDATADEFWGDPDSEISSVDTAIAILGLGIAARYFGGGILEDYLAARALIDWGAWLDGATPGHVNQFRQSYDPVLGFGDVWWDWWSHETLLVIVVAGASRPELDLRTLWRAWRRQGATYTSPGPDPETFTCYTTWNGDPFTVFYGAAFLGLHRLPPDLDGIDWFEQSRVAYRAHVEFFRKERGYLDSLSFAFLVGADGAIAEPKGNPDTPLWRTDATVHSVSGGLSYYAADPEANPLAQALSALVRTTTPNLFDWHGWPVSSVDATVSPHPVASNSIIGQDIALTALAVDNYLGSGLAHDLLFADPAVAGALSFLFPPRPVATRVAAGVATLTWKGVPLSGARLENSADLDGWGGDVPVMFASDGTATWSGPVTGDRRFFRLRVVRGGE